MKRPSLPFPAALCLAIPYIIQAQPATKTLANEQPTVAPAKNGAADSKAARDAEAARVLRERRANAQLLLVSLAADAGSLGDLKFYARNPGLVGAGVCDAR